MVYILSLFPLQNAVCFTILTYLVPVFIHILYTGCAKIKKNNSGAKSLSDNTLNTFRFYRCAV